MEKQKVTYLKIEKGVVWANPLEKPKVTQLSSNGMLK